MRSRRANLVTHTSARACTDLRARDRKSFLVYLRSFFVSSHFAMTKHKMHEYSLRTRRSSGLQACDMHESGFLRTRPVRTLAELGVHICNDLHVGHEWFGKQAVAVRTQVVCCISAPVDFLVLAANNLTIPKKFSYFHLYTFVDLVVLQGIDEVIDSWWGKTMLSISRNHVMSGAKTMRGGQA